MKVEFDTFLGSLSGELEPIRKLALRFHSGSTEVTSDSVALSRRQNIAPLAYAIRMFKPLPIESIAIYQQLHGMVISPHYLSIIEKLNGVHAFQFSLFGIPQSMTENPPVLNRAAAQPYDLATANRFWKIDYTIPKDWFHFGGGPYSDKENIGYFFDSGGTIHASRENGERLRSWTSTRQFLTEELIMAEGKYPAHETFMSKIIKKT